MKNMLRSLITLTIIIVLSIVPSSAQTLISQWNMNNSTADLMNLHNLTLSGATFTTNPVKESTHSLQIGSGQYANAGIIDMGNQFTITAWVYISSSTNMQTVISNYVTGASDVNGFALYINTYGTTDGRIRFETGNGTTKSWAFTSTGVFQNNQWNHIAIVVNRTAGSVLIYYNNSDATLSYGNTSLTDFNNQTTINLGRFPTNNYYLNGFLDDVRIYSGLLTASQIQSVYNLQSLGTNYTLTTSVSPASSGSISPASGTYTSGQSISVSATANAGYTFTSWSGATTGSLNPVSITMDANKTLTANFTPTATSYTLAISPAPTHGTITLNPSGGTYVSGTVVSVSALNPDCGYQFSSWSGNLSGNTNPTTITMNSNKTISASFGAAAQSAPTANSLGISGVLSVGQVLTGQYTYSDAQCDSEGASTFKWYRADNSAGSGNTVISGANAKTYTLTSSDLNKYIQFSVTPIAASGTTTGLETPTSRFGPVTQTVVNTWQNNGAHIYYNGTGNVGVGTSTPATSTKLHLFANSGINVGQKIELISSTGPSFTGLDISLNNTSTGYSGNLFGVKSEVTGNNIDGISYAGYFVNNGTVDDGDAFGIYVSSPQTAIMAHGRSYFDNMVSITSRLDINSATGEIPFVVQVNSSEKFRVSTNGNVGIGTTNPISKLQVGDGVARIAFGDAYGVATGYGIGYIGFNGARSGSNWSFVSDGANNGGAVIYSNVGGQLIFTCINTTGNSTQSLTDTQIHDRASMTLDANGVLRTKEIQVKTNLWADYVFNKDYNLRSLTEVESFINENGHLPEAPTAKEVEEGGLNLGEMNALLMKKVEELTLYMIEQNKKIELLNQEIDLLKNKDK